MKPINISLVINEQTYQLAGEPPTKELDPINESRGIIALDAFKQYMHSQLNTDYSSRLAEEFWAQNVEVRIVNGTISDMKQLNADLLFAEWLLAFYYLDHKDGEPI